MKKYISIMLIILAVAAGSCKKTYLSELAINPNTPAITTPGLQLSSALVNTAASTNGSGNVMYLVWNNWFSYSTGFQPSPSLLLYSITTGTYDRFSPAYANIANYNAILTSTTEPNYQAIAKIMICYDFQQLVDQYNNVPYFTALQGINGLTPSYDNASLIYDDLLKQLDAAITLIKNAPASAAFPGKFDVMYGAKDASGMAKWAAFANTLKLRVAVRQTSNATVFAAKKAALTTSLNATVSSGYITTTTEGSVNPGYTNTDGLQPPLDGSYGFKAAGSTAGVGAQYQANLYFVNQLVGSGTPLAPQDPRLFQIYAPSTTANAGGQIAATFFGQTTAPVVNGKTATPSKFSAFMLSPTRSAPIVQASEAFFLQAEAVKAGILTVPGATAATLYTAGITASFTEMGVAASALPAYLAAYPYPAADPAQEQAIMYQKWIAICPFEPLEMYCEILRTGYPAVPLSILPGVTATTYVQRLPYPTTEYNTNAINVNAQGTIDLYTSHIFWEK